MTFRLADTDSLNVLQRPGVTGGDFAYVTRAMPYLIEILLFLAPFAGFALWRRFNPGADPSPRMLWLALAGVGCGLVAAVWYGFSVRTRPHADYVPARIGEDGRVIPGQAPR